MLVCNGVFTPLISPHLTSSDLITTDVILSERSVLWVVAVTANWITSQHTTQTENGLAHCVC